MTQRALNEGFTPAMILNQALISAMAEVGTCFEQGEYYVPEMLIAARAMKESLNILKPKLLETKVELVGRVVVGTVKGDFHDIGKNLVAMMMEGAGFEEIDTFASETPNSAVRILARLSY